MMKMEMEEGGTGAGCGGDMVVVVVIKKEIAVGKKMTIG